MFSAPPWARRLSLRQALLAGVAVVAAVLSLASYQTGALSGLERKTIDARFGLRGADAPGRGVAIVALDAASLNAINQRPPIPRIYYARLVDRLRAAHPRLIAFDIQFTGTTDRRDDQALLSAIARDGPILLATHDSRSSGALPVPAGVRGARGAIPASAGVDTDPDGVLRRMLYAPVELKTLAVRAAELLQGHPVSPRDFPGNHAWIDFRGPPGTFPTYSFADVLDGRVSPSAFTGRTVLVGVTDPVEKDVFVTAASSVPMAGVEVQANALTTILNGFPLQSAGGAVMAILLIGLALLPAALSLRLAALWVLAATIGLVVAFLIACQLAFDAGVIVSMPDPILSLLIATAGSVAVDSFVQRRQLRTLQQFFGLLPSPVSDFFISYRRGPDSFVANALRDELALKFGPKSVFLDHEEIDAGQQFPDRIRHAIDACRAMIIVIGPGWLELRGDDGTRRLDEPGDWVRLEIERGLGRERLVVVPVLYGGARMPAEQELPPSISQLASRNAVSLTGRDLTREIDSLVRSMERGRAGDFLRQAAVTP